MHDLIILWRTLSSKFLIFQGEYYVDKIIKWIPRKKALDLYDI
jgi:hypothetical protein